MTDTKQEQNNQLLQAYHIEDLMHPKFVLRQVVGNGRAIEDDNLCMVSFDMNSANENVEAKVPTAFQWAVPSLKMLRKTYARILSEPTERIHMEGIVKNNTYLILEDKSAPCGSNLKDSTRVSGSCGFLNEHAAIYFVKGNVNSTTLLHEAIHHSDLRLQKKYFSNFPLYQTAIMIVDAQKSDSGDRQKTVRALHHVKEVYQTGQIYLEGLAWIGEMSLATLSNEKNQCAKNIKVLHALYTQALLKGNTAVMSCFEHFKSASELPILLNAYNQRGQQVGQNGRQILKREDDFVKEISSFRQSVDTIARSGMAKEQIPESVFEVCEQNGVRSATGAVSVYLKAKKLYDETKGDNQKMLSSLKTHSEIVQKNNKSAGNLETYLVSYFYVKIAENAQKEANLLQKNQSNGYS